MYKSTIVCCLVIGFLAVTVWGKVLADGQEVESNQVLVIEESPKTVKMIKHLLGDLHSIRTNEHTQTQPPKKRTCYFNGGLAHGCDYNDVMSAINEERYWKSPDLPGKRRIRTSEVYEEEE